MKMKQILGIIVLTILASCGGGGGGGGIVNNPAPSTVSGIFIDAAVQGLVYESTSHSGTTDTDGNFTCKTGETVEFYLKGTTQYVFLGDITCRSVVSPIEIVTQGAKTVEDGISSLTAQQQQIVKNALRLLQTLDSDGNSTNGISLSESDVDTLITELGISDLDEDLATALESNDTTAMTTALNTLVTAIGGGRVAVTETNATSHFETTIANCTATSCTGTVDEDAGDDAPSISFSSYTCLYGKMSMNGSAPRDVNGNNPGFTIVVLDNNSNDAYVLRTLIESVDENTIGSSQQFDSSDYNVMRTKEFEVFDAMYNRTAVNAGANTDNLMVSQIQFSDAPTSFLEYAVQSMPSDGGALLTTSGAFGSGLVGTFDWTVKTNCTLPTNLTN
jgi:hypothetical protein